MDAKVYEGLKTKRTIELATPPFQRYFRAEEEFYRDHCRGSVALEVGVANGRIAFAMAPFASRVVGIDTDEGQMEAARSCKPENVELYKMDASRTDFKNGEFDIVLMPWNLLGSLVGKAEDVLGEAKRVTREGGKILLTVYAENAAPYQREYYARMGMDREVEITQHYVRARNASGLEIKSERFTKEKIERLFKGIGLKPEISRIGEFAYLVEATKEGGD